MTIISIVASGSRGDVQPYLALAKGLYAAGYQIRFITSDDFETLVKDAGLDFYSTGIGAEQLLQSEAWRKRTEGGNFLTILAGMQKEMKSRASEMALRLPDLINGSNLLVTGVAGMGGVNTAATKLGIPVVMAYVFPFTPTSKFPSPLVSAPTLGGTLNRFSFFMTRQMMWQMSKTMDTETRKHLGIGGASFFAPSESQSPILYGYSHHVLPRPDDWSANQHVTGYWFLDEPDGWTPPTDLVEFLKAGAPPVYIGFGSMGNRNPEEAGQIALEALQRSGARGILASGWGGLKAAQLPDTVHMIRSIPHSWLFPRMAAVVHHGGAGTTAAGLRAGVPSIIVPFFGDQPFWGRRVADLGVGTQPIPRKQLTAERLAAAIREALSNTLMQQKASALGERISHEDGIANAVSIIHDFVSSASTTVKLASATIR